jgi:hypothetical protein
MENIIPRWEWRTFQKDLSIAGENIKKFPQGKTRESSEVYILSKESNNNTKIRDMLMDIKTLKEVNDDKLEQWCPIMKAGFPIKKETVIEVFKAFNVPVPELAKEAYCYEEYIGNIIKNNESLLVVDVFKVRTGYTINDCIVEIAEITLNNSIKIMTAAVELEDPAKVINTVRELKLDMFENINYIKALKTNLKF